MVMASQVFFSVRDIQYTQHCDGWTIVVTSDIPCHLFIRWTTIEPQIHDVPRYIRGTFLHGDRYFCFVTQDDNEQEEAGDTLVHTFVKRPWPICERRYFYFWGSVGGQTSVSTTAIFSLHFDISTPQFLSSPSNRDVWQSHGSWAVTHDARVGFRVFIGGPPNYGVIAGAWLTASYFIYRTFHFFNTSNIPIEANPVGGFLSLYITGFKFAFGKPHIYITQGVQNDPVTLENYGDQLPFTTILGQGDLSTFTKNQYNNLPLNQDGLAAIVKSGITKFCLRGQHDVEDFATYPYSTRTSIDFCTHLAGAGKRPILTLCFPV